MTYRFKLLALFILSSFSVVAMADGALLPRPPQLEPDVRFWIRVYTEITTDAGFIHDQRNLQVVYETLRFDPDTPTRERERRVEAERRRYHDLLLRLAGGARPATDEEQHVLDLWAKEGSGPRLAAAADDVRFQLGQADRFRAGLVRAGSWEKHIGQVLSGLGLPAELAALPHVESSFQPAAYSKDGAAGLWQFLRSTGRRFLRIDSAVDERLDPFRETEAAAQLLSYNYRLLGSWPLAITAYNHGAEGMRRARDQLGDDIVRIVRTYHSPTFGFASRNFYVSFLAALTVAQNAEQYFGKLDRSHEIEFRDLKMPVSAALSPLLQALDVDRSTLQRLNPGLRPSVWSGRRPIPAGYVLRLPAGGADLSSQLLAERLSERAHTVRVAALSSAGTGATLGMAVSVEVGTGADARVASARATPLSSPAMAATRSSVFIAGVADSEPFAAGSAPDPSQYYWVQPGDTVSSIADRTGVPPGQLMALNAMPDQDSFYEGQPLRLVASAPASLDAPAGGALGSAQQALQDSAEDERARLASAASSGAQPVSAAQAQAEGPQLMPGASGSVSADPVDYSVAADHSIHIAAAETLGHYADWLGIHAARLRELNHLHGRTALVIGRRLTLEFAEVTPGQFEQRRREYHERLQAAYFASHRIAGVQTYIARRGDSLWNITKHDLKVPIWLLQQYNPDLDFSDLRPGTQVALPKIEELTTL